MEEEKHLLELKTMIPTMLQKGYRRAKIKTSINFSEDEVSILWKNTQHRMNGRGAIFK